MVPAGKKYQESAFVLAGISCASKPGYVEHCQENIDR